MGEDMFSKTLSSGAVGFSLRYLSGDIILQ